MPILYHVAANASDRVFDFPEYNSAMVLRTSLWIDLLKRDPKAAKSWQPFELGGAYQMSCAAATYQDSNCKTVLVLVPNCTTLLDWAYHAKTLADNYGWELEIYSLSFDTVNRRRGDFPHGYLTDFFGYDSSA